MSQALSEYGMMRTPAPRLFICVLLPALFLLSSCGDTPPSYLKKLSASADNTTTWPDYGGAKAQHYAALNDINVDNVGSLVRAWEYRTGDVSDGKGDMPATSAFQNTPLLMNGTLFLCTPFNRVIALNPVSGQERWKYDPQLDTSGDFANQLVCRGLAWWEAPAEAEPGFCDARLFMATLDSRLIALDAETGQRCRGFGVDGEVDLADGVGDVNWYGEYSHTSPPAVIGDAVIVGGAVGDNARINAPSGVVRAFNARSGELLWSWDLAPPNYHPAPAQMTEHGYVKGTPNVWAPISVDASRDLVFVPTGNPSPDYYRPAALALDYYGSSVVALRGSTGEVVWNYQMVHNDHWDFDTPAQPALVELQRAGESVPALVQATKMGFLFVLHRETGEPLFPVVEKPVPQVNIAGDTLSPTQPFPLKPPPLVPISLQPADAWGLTPWDRGWCRRELESLRFEGMYTPPTEAWTLMYPGNAGGSNWGGIGIDPQRRIAIANVMDVAWVVRLIKRAKFAEVRRDNAGEISAQSGTPYGMWRKMLVSPLGLPCSPPPWGKLVAIDLDAGEILWDVPLGTVRDLVPAPVPWKLGVPNLGGPLLTQSGLVFIGAAMDDYIRAFDIRSGAELWKARLPAGGQATPMSYAVTDAQGRQRQFIVIAAGGHGTAGTRLGDSLVAYALPD
ncbi:pyrroloquinoline quinone-dependent dehydrogenase [Halieaceae bacterium IMCC14734]|uniref:Pyrroloquinoline quinone-dependent dehydrogenase n=1 Tax=Candidatus Litorirhabdus singularis TaxID=2518993 RepID=A0ABT3TBE5_9GAMM|nr:pyrroloquinoline quinone-dependent dehydrogenase [Candidatus Litorirhabdus singularis]MCX2979617.1 pyrroloquinoline quinone-dependent dehydrogenase [Candidatus Litorirhabdus singularis]